VTSWMSTMDSSAEIDAGASANGVAKDPVVPDVVPKRRIDPDLAAVIAAWPNLPNAVRAGILAMVKASQS
jgi:hypothetical protein